MKNIVDALSRLQQRIKLMAPASVGAVEAPTAPSVTDLVTAGDAANRERNWPLAERHYREALERDPSLGAVWVQLGHAVKEQGRVCEAEACYRRATTVDPESSDAWVQLGYCLKLQGRTWDAGDAFIRAKEIDSQLDYVVSKGAVVDILPSVNSLSGAISVSASETLGITEPRLFRRYESLLYRDHVQGLANIILASAVNDAKGILERASSLFDELGPLIEPNKSHCKRSARQNCDPASVLIVTPNHTISYANAFARVLAQQGFKVKVDVNPDNFAAFEHHIVFCPNVYDFLPLDYVAVQMEQLNNTRWASFGYLRKLSAASAIIDYSSVNISVLRMLGIPLEKLFYVPPITRTNCVAQNRGWLDRDIDILFYGDRHVDRRANFIDYLSRYFTVMVVSDIFGSEMSDLIARSKVVVNIHYYANAMLEVVRVAECIAHGTPVVSERCKPDFELVEDFGPALVLSDWDDPPKMRLALDQVLKLENWQKLHAAAVSSATRLEKTFEFYALRFMLTRNFVDSSEYFRSVEVHFGIEKLNMFFLTIRETPERERQFSQQGPAKLFSRYEGSRHKKGWVGCGLSYRTIFEKAVSAGLKRVAVCEDDVYFGADFEKDFATVCRFLDEREGDWDVFCGLIADVDDGTKVLHVEMYDGIKFVWINKFVSMVFNIYGEKCMQLGSGWDFLDHDPETNTIDRYLQRAELRVVIAYPFLVGHDESAHSTLWGIPNTGYSDMINRSALRLGKLISDFESSRIEPH